MTTARALFAPIGPTYDRMGATLSLGQDPRWRRFLVGRLPRDRGDRHDRGHVLDVATGTGLVAARLRRQGFRVTGVDQSPEMLAVARRRFRRACEPEHSGTVRDSGDEVTLVHASAEALPLASESFDHLTFTYLLRYVADPAATLAELARVVRPGGTVASLEFGVPRGAARPLWEAYVRTVLPLAGRAVGQGWPEVGDFLGGSIRDFWDRYPLARQLDWWHAAGLRQLGVKRLSLGGGVVIWGVK
jgi:demethylmenaquinone methyltransferase/2-methoxy-6-polyprenyl-1,4-benzoquinol methylase